MGEALIEITSEHNFLGCRLKRYEEQRDERKNPESTAVKNILDLEKP